MMNDEWWMMNGCYGDGWIINGYDDGWWMMMMNDGWWMMNGGYW